MSKCTSLTILTDGYKGQYFIILGKLNPGGGKICLLSTFPGINAGLSDIEKSESVVLKVLFIVLIILG